MVLHHVCNPIDDALAILDDHVCMPSYQRHGNLTKQRAHREPVRQPADGSSLKGLEKNLPARSRNPSMT